MLHTVDPRGLEPGDTKADRGLRARTWVRAVAVLAGLAASGLAVFLVMAKGSGVGARLAPSPDLRARANATPKATSPAKPDYAIVFASQKGGHYHLHLIKPDGSGESELTFGSADERTPAWSPDRSRIAFARSKNGSGSSGEMDIYVMAVDGTKVTRLTRGPANDEDPSWAPDGARIIFTSSNRSTGRTRIRIVSLDGTKARQLPPPPAGCIDREPAWSPSGIIIAFARECGRQPSRLFAIHVDGTGLQLLAGFGRTPDWSPDGSKLAYTGWGREGPAIYVMNADGTGKQQFTTDGSGDPVWSPDGSRIAFIADELVVLKLFVINVDGTEQRPLTRGTSNEVMPSW